MIEGIDARREGRERPIYLMIFWVLEFGNQ